MKRRLTVLCLIGLCLAAGWGWYEHQPKVKLVRMLDLPGSMRVQHSWAESSNLFYYMDAYGDIPCTDEDFRSWQAKIHGESITNFPVPFPIEGMQPEVQAWWTNRSPSAGEPMFQARRGGVTVVALWRQGKAFVKFGQRGELGETWEMNPRAH